MMNQGLHMVGNIPPLHQVSDIRQLQGFSVSGHTVPSIHASYQPGPSSAFPSSWQPPVPHPQHPFVAPQQAMMASQFPRQQQYGAQPGGVQWQVPPGPPQAQYPFHAGGQPGGQMLLQQPIGWPPMGNPQGHPFPQNQLPPYQPGQPHGQVQIPSIQSQQLPRR
ncbi:hypothetical protein B0J14DRAFT_593770 [Halenospora varia]|nr:hypothetical protein B0J14DRAFT_593770 [Halenospora varia]